MNGGDATPFEEDVQRGRPDPGLQHLRKITLSSEEEADYSAKCQEWLPGTTPTYNAVQDKQAISDRAVRSRADQNAERGLHATNGLSSEWSETGDGFSSDRLCGGNMTDGNQLVLVYLSMSLDPG